MTISASQAMNFNHLIAPQGGRSSAPPAGTSDFDHILNSTSGSNPGTGSMGTDHILNGGSSSNPGTGTMGFNHILSIGGSSNPGTGSMGFNHILNDGSSSNPTSGGNAQGTVSSSKNGDGTYTKSVQELNGQKVVDMDVTYANGKTKDIERTITVNADGSKTVTKTNAHGKTSTIDTSKSRDADGNLVIAREVTNAKGNTTDSTITVSKSATGEVDRSVTRTNAQGETETLDREISNADGVRTVTTTGTGYDGSAIDNETTWTTTA